MPGERTKRKLLKNFNGGDSDSDFEMEVKRVPKERNGKKIKIYTSSDDSDNEPLINQRSKPLMNSNSHKSLESDSESGENKLDASSDEDKPLVNVVKASNLNGESSVEHNTSSCSDMDDDDEPLDKKENSHSSEDGENEPYDEDKPLINVVKASNVNGKSSDKDDASSCSDGDDDDEPLDQKENNCSEENEFGESSEKEPVIKIAKGSKLDCKPKEMQTSVSSDDDEPLVEKRKKNASFSSDEDEPHIEKRKENASISSDEDEPLVEKRKKNASFISDEDEPLVEKRKKNASFSSDEDEPLVEKRKKNASFSSDEDESLVKKRKKNASSSDEDEPLVEKRKKNAELSINKKSKNQNAVSEKIGLGVSSKKKSIVKTAKASKVSSSESSDDDEPLASKKYIKQKAKKQRKSSGSSNGDEEKSNSAKSSGKKNDKVKTNDKIEHLKKYLRLSGIHINSYDKVFADCKSMKAKSEKLLSILHEKGLKGRPTIEKCKKLRKKIETKKEIAELDTSNIIKTEGRPKRGSTVTQKQITESSPITKTFSRLKNIIDSEESD